MSDKGTLQKDKSCKRAYRCAFTDPTIYLARVRISPLNLLDCASSCRGRNRNEIIEFDLEQKRSWFRVRCVLDAGKWENFRSRLTADRLQPQLRRALRIPTHTLHRIWNFEFRVDISTNSELSLRISVSIILSIFDAYSRSRYIEQEHSFTLCKNSTSRQ